MKFITLNNYLGLIIADSLPNRTGKQCRERWYNHLSGGIKKGEWTEEVIIYIFNLNIF